MVRQDDCSLCPRTHVGEGIEHEGLLPRAVAVRRVGGPSGVLPGNNDLTRTQPRSSRPAGDLTQTVLTNPMPTGTVIMETANLCRARPIPGRSRT